MMTRLSDIGSEQQQHYSGRRPIHGSHHERRSACGQEGKSKDFWCVRSVLQCWVWKTGERRTVRQADLLGI
jgi:hypothetical protein